MANGNVVAVQTRESAEVLHKLAQELEASIPKSLRAHVTLQLHVQENLSVIFTWRATILAVIGKTFQQLFVAEMDTFDAVKADLAAQISAVRAMDKNLKKLS